VGTEHKVRHRFNDALVGKPFEAQIRNVYSLAYGYYTHDPNLYYDKQTKKVMARVLSKDSNLFDLVGLHEYVSVYCG
jgi:hypothetical protein